jgi:hypothetical protein
MKLLFGKRKAGCEFRDSCICANDKELRCDKCHYYWWTDSGYGYCKAMPIPVLVAWCKDFCRFFEGD